ncbi:hypothetical protein CANCADRAFT_28874 [Tortispora caseinolytica NRRL Y-17796]|uniref:Inosine triphosphate pyrophosphatase n=1 Tax=Tortispora caseinolytica NRRL Y-17796 TaxID=767744 RepID=A0A1E4TBK4_9ASCO|nr:hypothetical protein CANCADRAFT_28874 [Tortispora caseinolytica NRRL Y-17796]
MLTFVTGNKNKFKEVSKILEGKIEIENQDIDAPEVQGSIEDVARAKCEYAARIVNGPTITEDTALCFNALNGLPGVYIKWFVKGIGLDGLNKLLVAFEDKSADAICTFAYTEGPNKPVHILQGVCSGKIVNPRGPPTFGWDSVFEPDEQQSDQPKTFAEMDPSEKNQISHRAKALKKLQDFLLK